MKKNILNENFSRNEELIERGTGLFIYKNKRKIYDLSQSSGVLLFGHNHKNFKLSLKNILSKKSPFLQNQIYIQLNYLS